MKKRNWFFILQMIPIYAACMFMVLFAVAPESSLMDALLYMHMYITLFSGAVVGIVGLFVAGAYKPEFEKDRGLIIALSIVDILISVGALFLALIVWIGNTY